MTSRIRSDPKDSLSIRKASNGLERDLIEKALELTGGNRTQAAKILEMSRPKLLAKIKEFDLDKKSECRQVLRPKSSHLDHRTPPRGVQAWESTYEFVLGFLNPGSLGAFQGLLVTQNL